MLTDEELDRLADRLVEKMEARKPFITPKLMDIAQTAAYIGRSVAGVTHMVKNGTLPVTRFDSKVQIDREVVDKMIKARTV